MRLLAAFHNFARTQTGRGKYFDSKIETLPVRELRQLQLRGVKRVLRLAYENCPLYRRLLRRAGVKPDDIRSLEDFRKKVPIVGKNELLAEVKRTGRYDGGIIGAPRSQIVNVALTSGTTGPNTFVALTTNALRHMCDMLHREYRMTNLRPAMTVLTLTAGWHIFGLANNLALPSYGVRNIVSPWGTFTAGFAHRFLRAIKNFRIQYAILTPGILRAMLDEAEKKGLEPCRVFSSLRHMVLAGEAIPSGYRRKLVKELELEDVYEVGGSSDGCWGGMECGAHEGHHIWMDKSFLEIVGLEKGEPVECIEGARGRAINTSLFSDSSVYLRFDSGDVIEWMRDGDCECGRTHATIELRGRVHETCKLGDLTITPGDVSECLAEIQEVAGLPFTMQGNSYRRFASLTVRIAWQPSSRATATDTRQRLEAILGKRLGVNAEVNFAVPGTITKSPYKRVLTET